MKTYDVYTYTFAGHCSVERVEASDKFDAKWQVLRTMKLPYRNDVQRQVADLALVRELA
jgi:hypothetical protein